MKYMLLLFVTLSVIQAAKAQEDSVDLTGTWVGNLKANGNFSGLDRNYVMTWELVQVEREVYGIVYFFPQDTKDGDKANCWYTWYGKMGKKQSFPFSFIQGRYIDGMGTTNCYQFKVELNDTGDVASLKGIWFSNFESLNTLEKPNGSFVMQKRSNHVSDQLWLKRREKAILDKINRQ